MQRTGNPLDVAIDGKGYLVVQTPRGQRYTRNGALSINAQGQLVTSAGDLVLGTSGPITFQPTDRDVIISGNGIVSVRDGTGTAERSARAAATRQLRQAAAAAKGRRLAVSRAARSQSESGAPGTAVVQGSIEKSNVRRSSK